jgi:hypothetical protein
MFRGITTRSTPARRSVSTNARASRVMEYKHLVGNIRNQIVKMRDGGKGEDFGYYGYLQPERVAQAVLNV